MSACEHRLGVSKRAIAVVLAGAVVAGSTGAAWPIDPKGRNGDIAFIRDGSRELGCAVFVVNSDGSEQQRLTGWSVNCSSPAVWSPDGKRLAFYARGSLWIMNADGTHRRRLSPAWYSDSSVSPGPSFSPDGRNIAFPRNPSSRVNASAVHVVRHDGGLRRLTEERFAYDPLWSPRGDVIAFRSDRDDDEGDIYLMRPDGSRDRRLTRSDDDVESIVWAPDGRFLAYAFYGGPVYRIPTEGGQRRRLARSSAAEPDLAWSPDGRFIAYANENSGSVRGDIQVMTARGFNERRLTKRFFNSNPSWSADSRQVAFAFLTRLNGPSRSGIAVIDADGSDRRELTTGNDSFPAWQPVSR